MKNKFKPGAITQISAKNFITYDFVTLNPGPNLNLLIGPNGTGKSTIVAAIIIGLGGNCKVVGRGNKISEYIKHGCMFASVTIVLQNKELASRISINREFTVDDKCTWKLNDKNASLRDVRECLRQFNIQVDNLCQFLPQDRVQNFVKLNNQQLLRQTEVALCQNDLIQIQSDLIEFRTRHKKLLLKAGKDNGRLQQVLEANLQLESKMKNRVLYEKYLENSQNITRKISWVIYENEKQQLETIERDYKKALDKYQKQKDNINRRKSQIEDIKKVVSQLQQKIMEGVRKSKNVGNTVTDNINAFEEHKTQMFQLETEKTTKISEIAQRSDEINETVVKLNDLVKSRQQLLEKINSDNIEENIQNCTYEINKCITHSNLLKEKKSELINMKYTEIDKQKCYENELLKLQNMKEQRLKYLYEINKDFHSAVIWLRANKNMFQDEVYEPMLLEINVLDPKNAIYVENTIAKRDLLAFTCVNKRDMNNFIRAVREQLNLTINVLHCDENSTECESFRSATAIEELRRYGMYAYICNLFTAPIPIMNYLCKTYNIHNVPVGDASVNENFELLPQHLTNFFSNTCKYSIKSSIYTGERSTSQTHIVSNKLLSATVDFARLKKLEKNIAECQSTCEKYSVQVNAMETKMKENSSVHKKLLDDITEMKNFGSELKTIEVRIKMSECKLENLKSVVLTPDDIEQDYSIKIKEMIRKMVALQRSRQTLLKTYFDETNMVDNLRLPLELTQKKLTFLNNKHEDERNLVEEIKEVVNNIKIMRVDILKQNNSSLQKIKDLCDGLTPEDCDFVRYRNFFNDLPSTLQELQQAKDHILAKTDCLNTASETEFRTYHERRLQIETLEKDIDNDNEELRNCTNEMDKLRFRWLELLNNLIDEINKRFNSALKLMGCAGEVSLSTGENEMDFDLYGLCIKVTYRNGEPLQELNSFVQSGGERAVATAVYLLSLQELTPVPFRCVDEINQGMDADNERKIFELLFEYTAKPDTAQYFLVTPKLIPKLKFVETVKIHVVHNGGFCRH